MVGLGALNFILRSVHVDVTGVAFDVEIAGMYSDDRAADTSSFLIPAHAIIDFEAFCHAYWIRYRGRNLIAKPASFRAVDHMLKSLSGEA